jgi:adenylate cyclase
VSKELGVRYVVEGSVRRANNQVRVTAQLVDATTDHHIWAERYDRPLQDIFAVQDEIRQKIVLALKVKLASEEQERFRHVPTDNAVVERAMRLDPKNATFHSHRLGRAYRMLGRYDEALTILKRVVSISPNMPGPRAELAFLYTELGQAEEARVEVAEILRISPNFSLEAWRQRIPYKNPADLERFLAALRKAGLK